MVAKIKKLIQLATVALVSLSPLLAGHAWAATATLYLSPSSRSIAKGSTITISVRENSGGEPVNAAQANLSYPANLFDFVGIGNSSAFGVTAQSSGGGGSVQIGRGALPATSGDQLIATVTFKAKTNTGTANVSFAGGSSVVSANSNQDIAAAKNGGSYALTNPAPAAPAPAAAPKDTTPPVISNIKATDLFTNYALIKWTTSEPSTSEVLYGPNQGYGLSAVDTTLTTDHAVKLSSPLIVSGTVYHFMVKSVDPAGNAATSGDQTFKTRGGTVLVTVLNQRKKGVGGAQVSIGDTKGTTDKKGQVTLKDIPYGKQTVTVTYKGKDTNFTPKIETLEAPDDVQPLTLKIQTPSFAPWIAGGIILAGLAAAAWFLRSRGMGGMNSNFSRFIPGSGAKMGGGQVSGPPAVQAPPETIKPTDKTQ